MKFKHKMPNLTFSNSLKNQKYIGRKGGKNEDEKKARDKKVLQLMDFHFAQQ